MPKSYDERFDRLEALIERGFTALAQNVAETKAEVTIVHTDIGEIKTDVVQIRVELKDIRDRLNALESSLRNVSGFAKEINHLLQPVGAIEKHLGIDRKIAG
jgi:hypothetical protein